MKFPFFLAFGHARRNWFRSLLTLGSVFVATLAFGGLRSIVASLEVTVNAVSGSRVVTESAVSLFMNLPKKLVHDIEALPGIAEIGGEKRATHWTWFGGVFVSEEHFFGRFATDPRSMRLCYGSAPGKDIELTDAEWKAFESTRTGCIIGKDLAAKFKWKIGDTIPLQGNIYPGAYALQVVGIYASNTPSFDQSTLFFQWEYLNETSKANGGTTDEVSIFSAMLVNPDDAGAVCAQIDSRYANSANRTRTQTERAFQANFLSMWGGMPTFFNFLALVAVAATFVITLNTMLLNAEERVKETGVLKTLGFGGGTVTGLLLMESVLICGVGGGLAIPLIRSMHGTVLPGISLPVWVPPELPVQMAALSLGLGLVAGLFPAISAGRIKIVDALRRRA